MQVHTDCERSLPRVTNRADAQAVREKFGLDRGQIYGICTALHEYKNLV
jgi:hypothetical protein